jgi:hypothetical protein
MLPFTRPFVILGGASKGVFFWLIRVFFSFVKGFKGKKMVVLKDDDGVDQRDSFSTTRGKLLLELMINVHRITRLSSSLALCRHNNLHPKYYHVAWTHPRTRPILLTLRCTPITRHAHSRPRPSSPHRPGLYPGPNRSRLRCPPCPLCSPPPRKMRPLQRKLRQHQPPRPTFSPEPQPPLSPSKQCRHAEAYPDGR